jgi:hypothetical protein
VLLQRILNVADEPLVLAPADPQAEWANTSWLSASPHERLGVSVAEVVAAFEELTGLIRARVRQAGHRGRATFYVWHDGQAGQLRCSTSAQPPERLPLGADYQPIDKLEDIVAEFLGDGEPGFVPFTDRPGGSPGTDAPFDVWTFDVTVQLPGDAA